MRSVQKTKVRIFSVWNEQLELYCIATMKLSENFRKTDEKSLKTQFWENQTKTLPLKVWKIFVEFSINFRQAVGDYYLNNYPTVLVLHFSQVCFSKHAKI